MTTSTDLLNSVECLASASDEGSARYWSRAGAVLIRIGLEQEIDAALSARSGADVDCSMRGKLLALPTVIRDERTASEVKWAWAELSRLCHHHPFERPATPDELARLVGVVRRLSARVGQITPIATSSGAIAPHRDQRTSNQMLQQPSKPPVPNIGHRYRQPESTPPTQ